MGNIQISASRPARCIGGEKPLETALLPTRLLDNLADYACGFLANNRGPAGLRKSRHGRSVRQGDVELYPQQPGAHAQALRPAQIDAGSPGDALGSPNPAQRLHEDGGPDRRLRSSGRDLSFRQRCEDLSVDRNCKAHELDNLYVVDTSFFVSIGAVNPSLTAIANAIRVGDHLLQRLA